ncbi:MAG: flagella basal body P-ring formation protein FlgA, partial [Alphaproteobacteria bacterium]
GATVLASDLREPVVVAKNSLVTIRLETPRMVLSAQGRAIEAGGSGDVIRVMNTASNKIIHARVVNAGLVRIEPAPRIARAEEVEP